MSERWLPVVGNEGEYEVSDQGGVRSLDRVVVKSDGRSAYWRGRTLKPTERVTKRPRQKDKSYRFVTIDRLNRKVAWLVLEAFVGPKPFPGAQARHLNDDSLDDRLDNLAWGTAQEDADDRVRNGSTTQGERSGNAKLTDADVLAIRAAYAAGVSRRELAEQYGVGWNAISRVVNRETWRHI